LYALIGLHNLIQSRRLGEARQRAQHILQLFAFGVEDVAQAQLFGGDGGDDIVEASLPSQRGINLGKGWQ
jgi:hypothetical protein